MGLWDHSCEEEKDDTGERSHVVEGEGLGGVDGRWLEFELVGDFCFEGGEGEIVFISYWRWFSFFYFFVSGPNSTETHSVVLWNISFVTAPCCLCCPALLVSLPLTALTPCLMMVSAVHRLSWLLYSLALLKASSLLATSKRR